MDVSTFEILRVQKLWLRSDVTDDNTREWWEAQLAVDGVPCVPFMFHESDYRSFKSPDDFEDFLKRKAVELLERYGDARQERVLQPEAA